MILPFRYQCLNLAFGAAKYGLFYPYVKDGQKTVPMAEPCLEKYAPRFMERLRQRKQRILDRGYFAKTSKQWFELWNQRNVDNFETEKVVTPELADHSRFAVADSGVYYGDTVCGIIPKGPRSPSAYALATILNSSVVQWYYMKATVPKANGFFIYKVMFLKNVPVPLIPKEHEQLLEQLGKLATFTSQWGYQAMESSNQFIMDLADACVMECYFHEHMRERDLLFLDEVADALKDYESDANNTANRAFLEHFVNTHNAPNAKIRNQLLRLPADSPDLLAVIKQENHI